MATQGPQNQEKEHILISKTNNGTCVCPWQISPSLKWG